VIPVRVVLRQRSGMAPNSTMRAQRAANKPGKKHQGSSRPRVPDVDAVLLRCATIERRLESIEVVQSIQAQRMSTLQEELDHLAGKQRR